MPEHRWIKYSILTLSILGSCLILAIAIRKKMSKRDRFISEDDLETFDGFLRYHVIDPSVTSPDELQKWRELFDEARQRIAASPKVGRMKFKFDPDEYRYAVAVRGGSKLWLALWVKRSPLIALIWRAIPRRTLGSLRISFKGRPGTVAKLLGLFRHACQMDPR